jgi:hypothetical protein
MHSLEQVAREERELLRPGRRRHVQRQDAATHAPRLRARRDALAHGSPPGFAVDHHTAGAGGHVARLLEQRAERGR